MLREHQSSQLKGHFPHSDTPRPTNSSVDRGLGEALDRMARGLLSIAESAESESVRLAAIKEVLNLGGITTKTSVEVDASISLRPFEEILTGIAPLTREESRAMRGVPDTPALAGPPYDEPEIVDAEIVDESPETRADRRRERRTGGQRSPVTPDAAEGRSAGARKRAIMPEMSLEDALENTNRQARKAGVYPERPRGRIKFR